MTCAAEQPSASPPVFFFRETGPNGYLSQWFEAPFYGPDETLAAGRTFRTCEHWMMWRKAVLMGDHPAAAAVLTATSPKAVKAIGRSVKNYDDEKWTTGRLRVVVEGSLLKFNSHPGLAERLLATGDAPLVEASPYDRVWGIGLDAVAAAKVDPKDWPGLNLLGVALMTTRDALRVVNASERPDRIEAGSSRDGVV